MWATQASMHNDDVNDGSDFCAKHMFRNMHADRACFGAAKLRLDEVFACRVIASYGESTHPYGLNISLCIVKLQ